jgi:hypothetical protein
LVVHALALHCCTNNASDLITTTVFKYHSTHILTSLLHRRLLSECKPSLFTPSIKKSIMYLHVQKKATKGVVNLWLSHSN